ncbi:M20 family metallopeptidase [Fictibacillus fluitans]|uniref:Peptidase M20 domain-containing protein 2 n=1 Tax=Fictibacillus fluitans TaxID=3058422 RepID=A0ABT8HSD2_9BACL|nr:M20 family metallopeptidase [Fictibacillus sp. NE201]MDN4523677.1 M20 family metallopeptidase [Fictibacillus sp. NE201]
MNEVLTAFLDEKYPLFKEVAQYIWNHPELGYEEVKSSAKLIETLEHFGFEVERSIEGMETAFIAAYDSGKPGPVISYLAEYDALPEIHHACGHNLIGTMSTAAGIAVSTIIKETGGKVLVYGTPAEETGGAKVHMAEKGYFDDVDAALMCHPYKAFERSGSSMAMEALQFDFKGKTAHAAASPHEGINALDAVIALFNSVNALRQQVTPDVRIHGVITAGGTVPNVIPDKTQARFYVRAATVEQLPDLVRRVKDCAAGAALGTGCEWEASHYELGYANLLTNGTMSDTFTKNLASLGIPLDEIQTGNDHGSLDLGNVSQVVPAVHPYIKITDASHNLHTKEFCDAANSEQGYTAMLIGAKALALTGYDLLTTPQLLQRVKEEFENREKRA